MSRIGKQTIKIPQGVTVSVEPGNVVHVKGPKGTLSRPFVKAITVTIEDDHATLAVKNEQDKQERSLWGTFGAHLKNMVTGVTVGFKKQLEINGVGYRVSMQGKDLKIEAGYSHPVVYTVPQGITISTEKNVVTVEGINNELVGQVTAEIRGIRKPEPYKGKGIKYTEEVIRRKAGKAAKSA